MVINKVRKDHIRVVKAFVEERGESSARCAKRSELSAFFKRNGYSVAPMSILKKQVSRGFYDVSWVLNEENFSSEKSPVTHTTRISLTDEEILGDQRTRFNNFYKIVDAMVAGKVRAVIAAGNSGIGKTYAVEDILEQAEAAGKINTFKSVKGYAKPTGLYRLLWENRNKGDIIVLDDCDSIFRDEIGLNILKGALDTTKKRFISWRSEKVFEDTQGEVIPDEFEYNGSILFITNLDFDLLIQTNLSVTPHLKALLSRSFYVDLHMRNPREMLLRIMDVVDRTDILTSTDISGDRQRVILNFMKNNSETLRELSLRMLMKLGGIMQFSDTIEDFNGMAMTTCTKR